MLLRLLPLAALLLTTCTTAGPNMASSSAPAEAKLFGDFLAGTYASSVNEYDARTRYYSDAFEQVPDDIFIGRRALSFAVLDGDMDAARSIARTMLRTDPDESMARTVLGEQAFRRGEHAEAARFFGPDTSDLTMGLAMDLMQGWNAVAMGDEAAARAAWETMAGGAPFARLASIQLAVLDARAGRVDSALAHLDEVDESELYETESALVRARILSQAGRNAEALDNLRAFADENNFESGPVAVTLAALERGETLPDDLTPRQLAARALTEPSYSFYVRARALDAAELYLRLARDLDPDYGKAKLLLAGLLENTEREDEALALYRTVDPSDPDYSSARLGEANIHFGRDEDDEALAILEDAERRESTITTREALGRARLIRENYEEALPIYDALVESLSEEELRANVQPLYFRGIVHERLDDFPSAVRDFRRVLEIEPDNADALNYLGYTWVDRGENLEEAFSMIERAVELEPDSGAIIDSLGWAHYKLGRYSEARTHLEKAATLAPASATIVDHLGDVYWKLGRYREAGYQWRRALGLDPTDEERESIEKKLQGGLEAVAPAP